MQPGLHQSSGHWPTNCWSYVEASFAIIASACLLRPHLTAALIALPIDAMIAGGLEDAGQVIAIGLACATCSVAYEEPGAEAKRWLAQVWPGLGELAETVFQARWRATTELDGLLDAKSPFTLGYT